MSDHLDTSLSSEQRADTLLARMTLEEKCWQLVAMAPWDLLTEEGVARVPDGAGVYPGHVAGLMLDDPRQLADHVRELQRSAVHNSRLGIPLMIHGEALNGVMSGGHMVFPTAIGLAATWSPELVGEMTTVVRRQMRRVGLLHALSPVMDVSLDPRWGRVHETYGEDPYLVAALSVAFTRGLQGDDLRDGILATGKHFLGYASSQSGINMAAVDAGHRRLRDLFAFPFEAAIHTGGLRSVMNSYSEIDGTPVGASREILQGLLRDTLGFEGFVSSDYMTIMNLVTRQRLAADAGEAGARAIEAGLDTEFPAPFGYGDALAQQVKSGRVSIDVVDASVRRILVAKVELGLFENPYPAERIDVTEIAQEGAALSKSLAQKSVTLVQNDGILPLAPDARVALIGPHASDVAWQFAPYTYASFREMTLIMSAGGMGAQVGIAPELVEWNARKLAPISTDRFVREQHGATSLADAFTAIAPHVAVHPGSGLTSALDVSAFDSAVDAAAEADVVVLALGGASLWFQGERTEGEASDSADIALPSVQAALAEAVIATGTPVILLLVQGRAYTLPEALQSANAIAVTSYNGPFGPQAVADVLFGKVEPEGHMPYSIPRHVGQLPIYHHRHWGSGQNGPLPLNVAGHYLDGPATPLVPFGRGLTYTDFTVEHLGSSDEFSTEGEATIRVLVDNDGSRPGVCTLQLYASLPHRSVVRPAQQLVGFVKVPLDPGGSAEVEFRIDATQLAFTGADGGFSVEPGPVEWFVGLDAEDQRAQGKMMLVGERRRLTSSERVFLARTGVRHEPA